MCANVSAPWQIKSEILSAQFAQNRKTEEQPNRDINPPCQQPHQSILILRPLRRLLVPFGRAKGTPPAGELRKDQRFLIHPRQYLNLITLKPNNAFMAKPEPKHPPNQNHPPFPQIKFSPLLIFLPLSATIKPNNLSGGFL